MPMYQVRVEDEMPPGASFLNADPRPVVQGSRLTWTLGIIEANAERRIKVEVQPLRDGEIKSKATASFSLTSDLSTRATQAKLSVIKKGPESIVVGDKAVFEIRVTNSGSGPASNVVIRDNLPPGLQHAHGSQVEADLPTLGPGQSEDIALEVTAVKAGQYVNEVIVTADDGHRCTARCNFVVTEPALAIHKIGPREGMLGGAMEYRLEVHNSGTATATGVRMADVLPDGLEFTSATDGGIYDPATRIVEWNIGTLPAGQTREVVINLTARRVGEWVNQALARGDRGLEARTELSVRIDGAPGLHVEATDLIDPVEVGEETSYEIRVLSQGSCVCSNICIMALVPDGLEVLGAEGPVGHRIDGQQVTFEPLPKLAARADAVYRIRIRGRQPGDWRLKVRMTADQLQQPVHVEESTQVYRHQEK